MAIPSLYRLASLLFRMPRWIGRRRGPQDLGERGEELAAKYLRRQGYRIVARGWRAGRGELDLVAIDRQTVVFVEVKTRRDQRHGHPAEAVDERKQRQIVALSERYRKRHRLFDYPVRYDIVAITWSDDQQSPEVSHFKAAFPAPDGMD